MDGAWTILDSAGRIFVEICLPVFALASMGWVLDRMFRLDLTTLVKLNIYLFVPSFIFVQVTGSELPGGAALKVVGFTLCMIASMFVLAETAGRLLRLKRPGRMSLQLGCMFYNSGNYGIPLISLAYPAGGPALQVFVLLTMNVSTFSVGLLLAAAHGEDRETHPVKRLLPILRQPSIYAIAAAFLFRGVGIPVREAAWLWEPLNYAASALVAFALVTLGVQLSQTRPPRIDGRLFWALVTRLALSPAVAVLLARAFAFDKETAPVLILGTSVPTAINTALIAHEFKGDTRFATAVVFYSTLFSLGTVTVVLTLLRIAYPQ